MKLTWFDANTWLWQIADKRLLIDPWLVGDLVFGGADWLIKGVRSQNIPIPADIDRIILSQGLPDHAHRQTLDQLDRSIPVIASENAAKVVKAMGFQTVTALSHGDRTTIGNADDPNRIEIQALVGAPVGPLDKENGYVLTWNEGSTHRLYYEPHGYPDSDTLSEIGQVDVIITPLADITILGMLPVVKGRDVAPKLVQKLSPQAILPTAEAGQISYTGVMSSTLQTTGGADELRTLLEKQGATTQVIQPNSGETLDLSLDVAK